MRSKLKLFALVLVLFAFSAFVYADGEIDITETTIPAIQAQVYTGKAITPAVTVTKGEDTLVLGTDYTVAFKNNIKVGTATVTVTGIGNYTGTKTVNFKIGYNIASAKVTGVVAKTYTGKTQGQKVTVKYGNTTLKAGTHYTVSYLNNKDAGTATLILTGKGNYIGTKKVTFKINRKSITGFTFSKVNNYTYTGKAITPNVTVKNGKTTLVKGTDYKLTYTNNINKGTATVTVTGLGNYTGTKKITYKINARSIATVTASGIVAKTYTGKAIYQSYKLTFGEKALVKGTDYTLVYTNNTKVGTATITFTGKGNYTGTLKKTFKIVAKSIADMEFSKVGNYAYKAAAVKPTVTVKDGTTTLKNGTDYVLTYKNNVNVGTATVIVTGKGNYTGTKEFTFNITARAISTTTITGLANKTYNGKTQGQSLVVKYGSVALKLGTDYTLAYANNKEVGTATVTVTGKGNYTGTQELTFKINRASIVNYTFTSLTNKAYTGSAITPEINVTNGTVALVKDTDYTVAYKNNTNVGTATVIVTGKGNYTGTKEITFKIVAVSISKAAVDSISDKVYTGKAITPAVSVTYGGKLLVKGTDYTVAYTNNIKIGTATVTLTGKGNYTGTKAVTFKIVKEEPVTGDKWEDGVYSTQKDIPVGIYKIGRQSTTKIVEIGEYGDSEYTGGYLIIGEGYEAQYRFTNVTLDKVNLDALTVTSADKLTKGVYKIDTASLNGLYKAYKGAYTVTIDTIEPETRISGASYLEGYTGERYIVVEGTFEKVNLDNYPVSIKNELKSGVHLVGYDVAPGVYKVVYDISDLDGTAYTINSVSIYENVVSLGGGMGYGWTDDEAAHKYDILTVTDEDTAVVVQNATITRIDVDKLDHIIHEPTDGVYVLGKDMDQGTYKIVSTGNNTRVVVKQNTREYCDYIYGGYIKIGDNVGFIAIDGAKLVPVNMDEIETNPQTTVSDGLYIVGKQIETGTYKVTGKGGTACTVTKYEDSYWDRNTWKQGYIEINEWVEYVEVKNGTLTKVNIDELEPNYLTTLSDGMFVVGVDAEAGWYKANDFDGYYYMEIEKEDYYSSFGTSFRIRDGYFYMDPEMAKYVEVNKGTLTKVDDYDAGIYRVDGEGVYALREWEKLEGETLYVDLTNSLHGVFAFDGTLTKENVESVKELGELHSLAENVYSMATITSAPYIEYTGEKAYNETTKMTDFVMQVEDLFDAERVEVYFDYDKAPIYTIDADEIRDNDNKFTFSKEYEFYGDAFIRLVKTVDEKEVYSEFSNRVWLQPDWVNTEATLADINDNGKPVYSISVYTGYEEPVDGYELYRVDRIDKPLTLVAKDLTEDYEITFTGAKPVTYFVRAYKEENGHKFYTSYSFFTLKPLKSYNIEETGIYRVSDTSVVLKNGTEEVKVIRHPNEEWGYIYVDESFNTITTKGTIMRIDTWDKYYKSEVSTGLYVLDRDLDYIQYYNAGYGEITVYYKDGTERTFNEQFDLIEIEDRNAILVKVQWTTLKEFRHVEHPASTLTDGLYRATYNMDPGLYAFSRANDYEWSAMLEFKNSGKDGIFINEGTIDKIFVNIEPTDTITITGGVLTKVDLSKVPVDIKETVSNGSFIVGKDLEPGMYELDADPYEYSYAKVFRQAGSDEYEYYSSYNNVFEITEDDQVVEVYNATLRKMSTDNLDIELEEVVLQPNEDGRRYAFYNRGGAYFVVATDPDDRSTWNVLTGNEQYYLRAEEETTVYVYNSNYHTTSILDELKAEPICIFNSSKDVFEYTLDSSNISDFDGWQVIFDGEPWYLSEEELKANTYGNGVCRVTKELEKDVNHNVYVRAFKEIDGVTYYTDWHSRTIELIPYAYVSDMGNGIGLSYRFSGTVRDEDVHAELYKCDHYSENIEDYELVMNDFRFNAGAEGGYYYITRMTVVMDGTEIVSPYSEPFYYAG